MKTKDTYGQTVFFCIILFGLGQIIQGDWWAGGYLLLLALLWADRCMRLEGLYPPKDKEQVTYLVDEAKRIMDRHEQNMGQRPGVT